MRLSLLPGLALCAALSAPIAHAQEWTPIAQDLLKEKVGYGGICGVVVEKSGDVLINLSDRGLYRSKDQGATWVRVGKEIRGRTETPGCIMLDPTGGGRMFLVLVYGAPIQASTDRGETMTSFDPKKTSHVDWCAVDWTDNKLFLTLKHESGGVLLRSDDGGKSFATEIGKGYGPSYVWDANTAVVSMPKSKESPTPKILRSTDGAKTFEQVAEFETRAFALPIANGESVYWLAADGLMRSKDKGKSWEKLSAIKEPRTGPIFGKSPEHLFVTAQSGILESQDGGKSWAAPIAAPKDFKGINNMTWIAYDPGHDSLYIVKMSAPLYRLTRKG